MQVGPPRSPDEWRTALRLLVSVAEGTPDEIERRAAELTAAAGAGDADLAGVRVLHGNGTVAAAGLFLRNGDETGFVWPPVAADGRDHEAAAALLEAIVAELDATDCLLAHAFVEPHRPDDRGLFQDAGFDVTADLLFLQRPRDRPPAAAEIDGRIVTYSEAMRERFIAALGMTYEGSGDCPAILARWPARRAIESHRLAGLFTPERWWLLEQEGRDAAVLLVNDRPEARGREVVYLGVLPEFRRTGLAGRLLGRAVADAIAAGCDHVAAAVDAANGPAVTTYRRIGFLPVGRRSVVLRFHPTRQA